jgi:hypothetical protein
VADVPAVGSGRLLAAVERLAAFLDEPLTQRIADLERALDGATGEDAVDIVERASVDGSLLDAALDVRADLGRINDLIHAAAITLMIPRILKPGERLVRRPSLAAGNDSSRPYDLETDRRVAEFKLSAWKGADVARQRQTFKDLVHLAGDGSGRMAELYVVGERPIRWLRSTKARVDWALKTSPATLGLFEERFGDPSMAVSQFTAGGGARVRLIDLTELAPDIMNRLCER